MTDNKYILMCPHCFESKENCICGVENIVQQKMKDLSKFENDESWTEYINLIESYEPWEQDAITELSVRNDFFIEIDKGMFNAISTLNKKGYYTCFCCEGHWWEPYLAYTGAYIMFKKGFSPEPEQMFVWRRMNCPEGLTWSKYLYPYTHYRKSKKMELKDVTTYYFEFTRTKTKRKGLQRDGKNAEHEEFLKAFEDWANSLPKRLEKHVAS